jgi:hypothetical protein
LQDCFPEFADEFELLRTNLTAQAFPELNQMAFPSTLPYPHRILRRLRRQVASINDSALLQKIRGKKDFDDFLQHSGPQKYLQGTDRSGPIVFINCNRYRTDAIVFGAKKVYTIALPTLNMDDLVQYALRMYQARIELSMLEAFGTACVTYNQAMNWLWTTAAQPILDNIDYTEFNIAPSAKPRVTWVSSGWLSLFPIHAAGDFRSGATMIEDSFVCGRVVSSYTSSLLVYSHMQARSKLLKSA